MIGNYLCTILFIAAAWLTGFAFLRLTGFCALHRAVRWIALPAGIAVFALSAAILYFGLEQNVGVIRIVCGIFAVVSLIYLVRKKTGVKQVVCLAAILILFTVMALPGMLRGTKWYVHRGNIWDKEFYLSEVVYMCRYDINYGMEGIMQEEYPSDVLVKGYSAVQSDRPVVPLLCALLASEGFGDLFFLAYLFIIMVWAAIFCAMMCVMELVMEGLKKGEDTGSGKLIFVQIFFAAIYTLGFYGQLQYDIDAWSQIGRQSAGLFLYVFSDFQGDALRGRAGDGCALSVADYNGCGCVFDVSGKHNDFRSDFCSGFDCCLYTQPVSYFDQGICFLCSDSGWCDRPGAGGTSQYC